jgi:branched-chain amino acid transport system ATP-binding protein
VSEGLALLQVRSLVKRFGGVVATDRVDLDVNVGELHAVIGPNGAGKTTLISLLSGELQPDSGSILFDGQEMVGLGVPRRALRGVGRSYQISQVFRDMTALQNVMLACQAISGHSFSFFRRAAGDSALINPAREVLELVGLGDRRTKRVSELAHGEHRQLELAMALAIKPRLLLLDEPMAGMSQTESAEMISLLKKIRSNYAVILVEHDMDAVFSLADRVSVLVYGQVIASGNPDAIRNDPGVKAAYLGDELMESA